MNSCRFSRKGVVYMVRPQQKWKFFVKFNIEFHEIRSAVQAHVQKNGRTDEAAPLGMKRAYKIQSPAGAFEHTVCTTCVT